MECPRSLPGRPGENHGHPHGERPASSQRRALQNRHAANRRRLDPTRAAQASVSINRCRRNTAGSFIIAAIVLPSILLCLRFPAVALDRPLCLSCGSEVFAVAWSAALHGLAPALNASMVSKNWSCDFPHPLLGQSAHPGQTEPIQQGREQRSIDRLAPNLGRGSAMGSLIRATGLLVPSGKIGFASKGVSPDLIRGGSKSMSVARARRWPPAVVIGSAPRGRCGALSLRLSRRWLRGCVGCRWPTGVNTAALSRLLSDHAGGPSRAIGLPYPVRLPLAPLPGCSSISRRAPCRRRFP